MKLTREQILKCFDNKCLKYEVLTNVLSAPKDEDHIVFIIKDNTNLMYFSYFDIEYHDQYSEYYDIKGDMFFVCPCGTLNNDFICTTEVCIHNGDFDDMFVIKCSDFPLDEIDDMILNSISLKKVTNNLFNEAEVELL